MADNIIRVFGHTNPDTDSISCAITMANLQNQIGREAQSFRLGEINKETQYALSTFDLKEPELLSNIDNNANVIMVDNNEFSQSLPGIEKAHIQMVVDHHRLNLQTAEPVYCIAEPVGCASTIMYKLYKQDDVTITPKMAGIMLSAIISDTLMFKSPTCTPKDKEIANELAKIAKIDIESYGMEMLKAGTDLSDFSAEELINLDSKAFEANGTKFQVAQVNTACIDDVLKDKEKIENAINNFISVNGVDLFLFAITDIINSNSQAIVLGEKTEIAEKAFNVKLENNMAFLPGVVSRKKQIIPVITENA